MDGKKHKTMEKYETKIEDLEMAKNMVKGLTIKNYKSEYRRRTEEECQTRTKLKNLI